MKHLLSLAFLVILVSDVFAQETAVTAEPIFIGSSPVVIRLPLPETDAKWSGVISVGIAVNELGAVSVEDNGEGPFPVCKNVTDSTVLAMRSSAVEAAKKAKFSPLVIDGQPKLVSGRLNYRFSSGQRMRLAGLSAFDSKLDTTNQSDSAKVITASTGSAAIVVPEGTPPISPGTVLNGRAVLLAKPSYPAAAKAVRAAGAVNVQVVIYEDGTMYAAEAISGHPLLRRSSEIAACSSQFAPTLLNGIPVKVAGIVTYNYVP